MKFTDNDLEAVFNKAAALLLNRKIELFKETHGAPPAEREMEELKENAQDISESMAIALVMGIDKAFNLFNGRPTEDVFADYPVPADVVAALTTLSEEFAPMLDAMDPDHGEGRDGAALELVAKVMIDHIKATPQ